MAIHRAVEHQAATRGDTPAYVDDGGTLTYRELNTRANTLARALIACGFKRGSLAAVRMERSPDLAVTLLAVLKAGGAYMWADRHDASWPDGVSMVEHGDGGERRCIAVDVARVLSESRPSPNLPILTRGTDIACVLRDRDGSPAVLVPHSTMASLTRWQVSSETGWSGDGDTLDLWLALMNGATITPMDASVETAAA
jgi:non-ribosomal peptide synthetase component F